MKKLLSIILVILMAFILIPTKEVYADESDKIIIWEWDGSSNNHTNEWHPGRFAPEWRNSTEAIISIDDNQWEWMKKVTFYIDFNCPFIMPGSSPMIIICTGWWSDYLNDDSNTALPVYTEPRDDEVNYVLDNGDGTFTIVLNLVGQSIVTKTSRTESDGVDIPDEFIPLDYKDLGILPTGGTGDFENNGINFLKIYFKKYNVTNVDSVTIRKEDDSAVFTSDGQRANFKHVEIDGEKIEQDKYVLDNAETKVSLSASYLLSEYGNGSHTFSFAFKNGHADTSFTIDKQTPAPTPEPAQESTPEPTPEPRHEILNTGVK